MKYTVKDINLMFADNTKGAITAKILRDFALSVVQDEYGGAVEAISIISDDGTVKQGWCYKLDDRTQKVMIGEGATDFSIVIDLIESKEIEGTEGELM